MVPDYCVPDALAHTGTTLLVWLLAAIILCSSGTILIVRRKQLARSRNCAASFLVLLALTGLSLGMLGIQPSYAASSKDCPKGYHYDASKDKDKDTDKDTAPSASASAQADKTPEPSEEPGRSVTPEQSEEPGRSVTPDESELRVATTYTMKADGSTGRSSSGENLINWDIAKKTIRAYMNASPDGIANKTESPYIADVTAIAKTQAPRIVQACQAAVERGEKPAAIFDADDTTLWTYDMEDAYMNFEFTSAKQQAWFNEHQMPATPGMVELVKALDTAGCKIIGLTGRKDSQRAYTVKNLTDAGYVRSDGRPIFDESLYFTKFDNGADLPEYLQKQARCDLEKKKCTTVQFKAGTRQHVEEDLGYKILANFGDQYSDLQGGYAENAVKLPNSTYYLPSPNLSPEQAAKDKAAGLEPPDEYTFELAPDGSSGKKPGVRDIDVPNMDIVKATLRTYYNAHAGETHKVANKQESPYLSELTKLTDQWASKVATDCKNAKDKQLNPAITLDADDTTLWTYDMEEWLEFAFNADKQRQYLLTDYHALPATPGMPKVVKAAKEAGCEVIGLTGRSDELKAITLRNLQEAGYNEFNEDLYFTKTSSLRDKLPNWVTCQADKCTTVEFKSSVRKHIEQDLGYRIVGNFGDQFSDLKGGYADHAYKLPNPTYYLP